MVGLMTIDCAIDNPCEAAAIIEPWKTMANVQFDKQMAALKEKLLVMASHAEQFFLQSGHLFIKLNICHSFPWFNNGRGFARIVNCAIDCHQPNHPQTMLQMDGKAVTFTKLFATGSEGLKR